MAAPQHAGSHDTIATRRAVVPGWVANRGNLCCYCAEPAIGLKSEPGDQAATKDHAMMEPATEVRNAISFGPFSLFVAERLLKKADEPIPLGGRALDILIALAERAGKLSPTRS